MLEIKAKGNQSAEIMIYDDIGEGWLGGISAKQFADEVKKLGRLESLTVRINSYGGSVFDGLAIYNTLKSNPARVNIHIDGIAASIASIIAMSGDDISMAGNGFFMIHDPWTVAAGTASDLRDQADIMDKVRDSLLDTYTKKASVKRDVISDMMAAETWMNATEALDYGFIHSVSGEMQVAACANPEILSKFKHKPDLTVQPKESKRLDASKAVTAKMAARLNRICGPR